MLSILIPTYNYNVVSLVEELYNQCINCKTQFEILVYDDGSKSDINSINNSINDLYNCTFIELPNNIGRSAIRNLLGENAKYEDLIFVDAGTLPKEKDFIKKYLSIKNEKVICGGMTYLKKTPSNQYRLRWVYTKNREQKALCSSNFFIKKKILTTYPFDERITKYGYEDVLFFSNLKSNNISIFSFENSVIHNSDDNTYSYLKKTEDAIKNLLALIEQGKLGKEQSDIFKYYLYFEKIKIVKIVTKVFNALKKVIILNLNSNYPSLFLFDMYRLCYFCQLNSKK